MASQNEPLVIKAEFFFCNGDLRHQQFIDDLKKRLAGREPRCMTIRFFDRSGRMATLISRSQPANGSGTEMVKFFISELIDQLKRSSLSTMQIDEGACAILRHEGMPSVRRLISQAYRMEFSLYSSGVLYEESLTWIARHTYRKLSAEH